MNPIVIFRGTSGLNTVADPARIPITKSGVNDIAEAINITIDQYGRPSRRKGFELLQAGSFHSLFCDGGDCFVARSGAIYSIDSDYVLHGIRSGMTEEARISWCQYGNKTYYTNGYERGVIVDGISYLWNVGEYHGPTTNMVFTVPDSMTHLQIHSGRMFASSDNVLWWSEPFRFDLFNLADGFVQFHTKIRLVKAVTGGVFVSTDRNTYFLSGINPSEFNLRKVCTFPAVEWSDATDYIDGADIGTQEQGMCALWASTEGAIVGTPSGQIVNLNRDKIIYHEDVTQGFGGLFGYHYIHGMI